ncbi:hypothetical protein GALL_378950 [mine drainage metagenome]|jgi:hypothetical protein|uniref:Nucleic acid binding, OB-fold, tRNA/helicase-type n=1 Tax=mine drainage metagenome TaxID=410659 RepID=A0A1J5QK96_9ZZZZ
MKSLPLALLCLVLSVFSSSALAAGAAAGGDTVHGKVVTVKDVGGYTYLQLDTASGKTWAAVYTAPVHVGEAVTIEHAMVMKDFTSKAMGRTFPSIVFGMLQGSGEAAVKAAAAQPAGPVVHVAKASGADARTVGEISAQRAALKGKTVVVRGKVVKYYPQIMGRNWVHLRDGTGSTADESNELLVTTNDTAKVGDIVTATGVVAVDKDFGAGYAYRVLLEQAHLKH